MARAAPDACRRACTIIDGDAEMGDVLAWLGEGCAGQAVKESSVEPGGHVSTLSRCRPTTLNDSLGRVSSHTRSSSNTGAAASTRHPCFKSHAFSADHWTLFVMMMKRV